MKPIAGLARSVWRMWSQIVAYGGVIGCITLMAGCATSPVPIGLPCNVGPIYLDKGASTRLTRDEQVAIAVVNRSGEQLCRWKPPGK